MELDLLTCTILIVFGFIGSFINAVVGGGALITLPVLMSVGLPPSAAIATNKLSTTLGNVTSMLSLLKAGKIHLKLIGPILPFVFIFSMVGAWTVHLMDPSILKPLILIMLIVVLAYTLIQKDWDQIESRSEFTWKRKLLCFSSLVFLGFYDGFFGPGIGSFLMFVFLLMGFDFLQAIGNAKLVNVISNVGALIMFIILDEVVFTYGLIMGASMIAGAFFGTKFAIKHGAHFIRILFILITVILIVKNIIDYFRH